MTVEIFDRECEGSYIIRDVVRVEEKAYGFILTKKDGFSQTFLNNCDFKIIDCAP